MYLKLAVASGCDRDVSLLVVLAKVRWLRCANYGALATVR